LGSHVAFESHRDDISGNIKQVNTVLDLVYPNPYWWVDQTTWSNAS